MEFKLDRLPGRCAVDIVFSGPLQLVYAKNLDTGRTGPLVPVTDGEQVLWTELDPDGTVADSMRERHP